jgi:protein-tyrosine phosphatase
MTYSKPDRNKTNKSNPLRIAELRMAPDYGRIGITICPGKIQDDAERGCWQRDLDLDLDAIRDWNASAVVTLIEDHEFPALNVDRFGDAVRDRNMQWYHLPIADLSPPDDDFEKNWIQAGRELRLRLRNGLDIVVHCKGGLGRSGTVAAKLLVELGMEPAKAIKAVRKVRPGAIETKAQELYVSQQKPVRDHHL